MSEFDTLATSEMERHRGQLLYADRQRLKAGEYETVTQDLVRRSRFRLFACGVATCALLVSAALQRNLFQMGWAVAMLVVFIIDHSHAKRTHETIRRLKEVAGAQAGERVVGGTTS